MLVDIFFRAMSHDQRGTFIKLGLRRAQAISVVDAAVILTIIDGASAPRVKDVAITLGSVAPTIIHAQSAEVYLKGRELNEATIAHTAELAQQAAQPIDDVRGSAAYRQEMVRVCVLRALQAIRNGEERVSFPAQPVLLWGKSRNGVVRAPQVMLHHPGDTPIEVRINGKDYRFNGVEHKTLMRLLREDAGLTGTKEGCAEGECGACTVFLDGRAVMSCLVPAVQAHGCEVITIEGLQKDGRLHPVQQAFVEEGAVQCGYCTPGLVMSAAKLLEELPHPGPDEIRQSITGNLCRCTGYYKIIQAVENASRMEVANG
jgi:carbon-monoxide dehydrogenase medium subunit